MATDALIKFFCYTRIPEAHMIPLARTMKRETGVVLVGSGVSDVVESGARWCVWC